jgi:hypothetical protein
MLSFAASRRPSVPNALAMFSATLPKPRRLPTLLNTKRWKVSAMLPRKYLLVAIVGLFALASPAMATPWWVSYEGNDYPENEGWERFTLADGAERSLEDGCLVLNSLASWRIVDDYSRNLPSLPAPGETFRAEWRLRVDENEGWCDSGICVQFAGHGDVFLKYQDDRVFSHGEGEWIAAIVPGVFHQYVITSADLDTYVLYIDGLVAYVGVVSAPSPGSYIGWGDTGTGAGTTSLTTWDYVWFGCVPEPPAGALFGSVLAAACGGWTRRARVASGLRRRGLRAPDAMGAAKAIAGHACGVAAYAGEGKE